MASKMWAYDPQSEGRNITEAAAAFMMSQIDVES